jgi:anti-anti-sigma factor
MEITVSQAQGRVSVTILKTKGQIDGSNYEELIDKAKIAIDAGTTDILLDLADTEYMSTAGMVAIQSIARMLRGEAAPDTSGGWDAIHDIARDSMTKQGHLKLLNPQPKVEKSLETIGFKAYFQIFTDRDAAIKAY